MPTRLGRRTACRRPAAHLHIKRRVGLPPRLRGSTSGANCPDFFELHDGRIAVIGTERTTEIRRTCPGMRSLADGEVVVVVDRLTLAYAKADIADN